VIVLRDDCARLLHELEHRYQRVARVPRRIRDRTVGAERAVTNFVSAHPASLAGAGLALAGAAVLLVWGLRRSRRPSVRARLYARRLRRQATRLGRASLRWTAI
jgi:hypothetical protein